MFDFTHQQSKFRINAINQKSAFQLNLQIVQLLQTDIYLLKIATLHTDIYLLTIATH